MLKKIHSVVIYVVCSLVTTMATDALAIETGLASYYADKFQGRQTASGEKYDRNKLTAAHRSLPIGSQIEVTNLQNQNSVIVTINDRGPYSSNRKLDLSYAAAKELGLVAMGTAPVTFDLVSPEKNSDFEKIIPLEYSHGALEVAKSEEEVIEAEEELANSGTAMSTITNAKVHKATKARSPHKAKKVTAESEKSTAVSKSKAKTHEAAKSEKVVKSKTPQSEKTTLKQTNSAKKTAPSDKNAKKHSQSKKS
jgi:rare lipoprotein A